MDGKHVNAKRRAALIRNAFGDSPPTGKALEAVDRIISYLDRKGMPDLSGNQVRREEYVHRMEAALRDVTGMGFREMFGKSNENTKVQYRAFCYERYRTMFPLDSSRSIARAFGDARDSSTIRYALGKLPFWLKYEPSIAKRYAEFTKALEARENP